MTTEGLLKAILAELVAIRTTLEKKVEPSPEEIRTRMELLGKSLKGTPLEGILQNMMGGNPDGK